jgi:hypothetical protein
MPVVDGVFVPNFPLALAEQHVDFVQLHAEILQGRARVEAYAFPEARRLATALALLDRSISREQLERRFQTALERVARAGFRSARAEIQRLRAPKTVRAVLFLPPPPVEHTQDMQQVRARIRRRSQQATEAVQRAVTQVAKQPGLTRDERLAALILAARKATHNVTLELVGDALNHGRTAGALSFGTPPEFAMRSEQLDGNTCDPCNDIHGTIVQVDTTDYYDVLPPGDCMGGGRCRGVMVFGDGPADMTQEEEAA